MYNIAIGGIERISENDILRVKFNNIKSVEALIEQIKLNELTSGTIILELCDIGNIVYHISVNKILEVGAKCVVNKHEAIIVPFEFVDNKLITPNIELCTITEQVGW